MVKQQPNRKGQAADAVRSGSVMAGASLLLALPAALLIREGVLPETSMQLTALVCAVRYDGDDDGRIFHKNEQK